MSRDILLSQIDPNPNQPRKHFDEVSLNELAESIKANGLAVPILVRPNGDRFEIVHGERRYKAAKSLRWETIPAEVRDLSSDDAQWLALVENIQRNDLSPIEEAKAYQSRLDDGLTQVELGQRIGKSQSYIAQKLRLLKLPADVKRALNERQLSEGHGRQLLRLKELVKGDNSEVRKAQQRMLKQIVDLNMSVADTQSAIDMGDYKENQLEGMLGTLCLLKALVTDKVYLTGEEETDESLVRLLAANTVAEMVESQTDDLTDLVEYLRQQGDIPLWSCVYQSALDEVEIYAPTPENEAALLKDIAKKKSLSVWDVKKVLVFGRCRQFKPLEKLIKKGKLSNKDTVIKALVAETDRAMLEGCFDILGEMKYVT